MENSFVSMKSELLADRTILVTIDNQKLRRGGQYAMKIGSRSLLMHVTTPFSPDNAVIYEY